MLPNSKICEDVFVNTVFKYAKPGTLMIDSSTISPATARNVKFMFESILNNSFMKKELRSNFIIWTPLFQEA